MTKIMDEGIRLHDFEPKADNFREEVLHGLTQPQKTLPCKFFYDERGSQLFDQICELEEYYLTRTEMAIMCQHVGAMTQLFGLHCLLVEYGSGSSTKTRILLDHLQEPAAYVPIDISREHLVRSAIALRMTYPGLQVLPVCADYTQRFTLPNPQTPASRTIVYFPGSTIGNFQPHEAQAFLSHIAQLCGKNGGLLIGVDLKKDIQVLEPAYNDARGVTADFNLNLLRRINRELGADFNLDQFRHCAIYNAAVGRIEMHLISECHQVAHLDNVSIPFDTDEHIITEYSYKYSLDDFSQLAAHAGFKVQQVWMDEQQLFSVQYLTLI